MVGDVLGGHGLEQPAARAEALLASFDGILLAALLEPDGERQDYLARSLDLAMHPLGVE